VAMVRAHPVDPAVTRGYHCIARCVRRGFLLCEGANDRKIWIDHRLLIRSFVRRPCLVVRGPCPW
jgi:hypothetical protein